jgi:hypothetical protein
MPDLDNLGLGILILEVYMNILYIMVVLGSELPVSLYPGASGYSCEWNRLMFQGEIRLEKDQPIECENVLITYDEYARPKVTIMDFETTK